MPQSCSTQSLELSLIKRRAQLDKIRRSQMPKAQRLGCLINWLAQNPDWTHDLPAPPPTLTRARQINADLIARGQAPLWIIWPVITQKYHAGGVWEVRQARDGEGQKFPGVGTQGIYDARGVLIPHEGTADIASPRSFWAGDMTAHSRTDVDLWQKFVDELGPLNGEKRYRQLYGIPISARFNTEHLREQQRRWEIRRQNAARS